MTSVACRYQGRSQTRKPSTDYAEVPLQERSICVICGWLCLLLLFFTKSDLHDRQGVGIVLLFLLEFVKVVIGAACGGRIFTTHRWTRVIDPAATCLEIEELARFAQQRIALTAQHSFLLPQLRVTHSRDFFRHAEVFRQAANIARCDLHAFVHRTAERRTLNAIVISLRLTAVSGFSHDRSSSYRRLDFLYSACNRFMNSSRFS